MKTIRSFLYWYRNQDKFLYHPHCSAYQLSYDGKWRCMTCGKEVVIEVGELK